MNLLLDTHTFVWALKDPKKLSPKAHALIQDSDNAVYVSSASLWEMAIKHQGGKFPEAASIIGHYPQALQRYRFFELLISGEHGIRAAALPTTHKDPFDRLLIAQSELENMMLVSIDPVVRQIGGTRVVW